jgi:predicted amidophosphoribosyltransferase
MDQCPECFEDIRKGATFCKHCNLAIDPASVAARAKKRERENAKLLKDEEEPTTPPPAA